MIKKEGGKRGVVCARGRRSGFRHGEVSPGYSLTVWLVLLVVVVVVVVWCKAPLRIPLDDRLLSRRALLLLVSPAADSNFFKHFFLSFFPALHSAVGFSALLLRIYNQVF